MNEAELQRFYKNHIYPRDSRFYSDRGFVNIDIGSQSGTHWTCFLKNLLKHTTLTRLEELLINFH